VSRVKELDKDAARRALRRAAVNNANITVDSRPSDTALWHELSYSLDNDVLSAAPRSRLTQLCDILAHCTAPPNDTVQQHVSLPGINDDGRSTDQGAWFLPLSNSRSARSRRRASTLDDIDESLYEPVVLSRHHQLAQPTGRQPIVVWPSDVEYDERHDAAAEKRENDIDVHVTLSTEPVVSDVQTQLRNVDCNDTGKNRSTRSPNSDPVVSLDHQRAKRSDHCTPVAGGVQSDFVLSSSMRPVTPTCPREALCKIRAEGDHAISALNSTVCSDKVSDYMPSADVPGDCCQLQSTVKVSSKLNNTFGVLPIGECIVTNSNLTCCRMQQVVEDNSSYCDMIRRINKATDRATEQTIANNSQTLQRTANVSDEMNGMVKTTRTEDSRQPQTQARRSSDSKQANITTEMTTSRSQVVEKQQSLTDVSNNKSGCSSSPNNVRLLADLISKISELATRQDQLERITPTSRATTNKSSQTDDLRRQTVDESRILKRRNDTQANNKQQLLQLLDDYEKAEQSVIRRQEERLLEHSGKQHYPAKDTLQSQAPERKISSQMKNDVSQAKQAIHTTPNDDASEATKLTDSSPGQQCHNVTAATSGQLRPPGQFVERSPLSDVTDNIIHVVRGSSALDDLTVEELMRQYSQLRRVSDESVAHRRHPAVETVAHSQPLPPAQSVSPVTNGAQRRYQDPTTTINSQDNQQHLSRLHDGRERRENTSSDSFQQTTNDDQTGHRYNRQSPQHADSVSFQHLPDQSTTHGKPRHSPRQRRESKTPQRIDRSTLSACHLMQPDREQHSTAHGARRNADEPHERPKTSQPTTDDHDKLRMQYVACAVL